MKQREWKKEDREEEKFDSTFTHKSMKATCLIPAERKETRQARRCG